MSNENQIAKQEQQQLTHSQRFMNKILAEFGNGVAEIALSEFQGRLVQNYFMAIDAALKTAEVNRKKKSEEYRDSLPVTWENVNMELASRYVVAAARIGLDPMQKNHLSMVPFKDNSIGKYNITFVEGYRGIELKAKKYGLEIPDHVIVELVYANDKFRSIKKNINNKIESYEFEVVDDFDRGTIKGGFYYHIYEKNPEKNKLVVMTLKDIEKRKPEKASAEFWGGEKDVWENGKKTGKKVKIEGWYEKMCHKTVYRAAYSDITIDSQKIDKNYHRLKEMENSRADAELDAEITENANTTVIDIDTGEIVQENVQDASYSEVIESEPDTETAPSSNEERPAFE